MAAQFLYIQARQPDRPTDRPIKNPPSGAGCGLAPQGEFIFSGAVCGYDCDEAKELFLVVDAEVNS